MSTDLVTIASHLTPLEGELLRIRLAYQGIRASLEKAEFVTWFWYLSNAVGGVKVAVPSDERERALAVLDTPAVSAAHERTEESCPKCGEALVSDWIVCWKCGTASDGTEDPTFFRDSVLAEDALRGIRSTPGIAPLLVLLIGIGIFSPAIFLLIIFHRFLGSREFAERDREPLGPANLIPEVDPGEPDTDSEEFPGDKHSALALRSALLGICFFPPLIFHSLWVLLSVDFTKTRPSRQGWRWLCLAWLLNLVIIGLILFMLLMLLRDVAWFIPLYHLLEAVRSIILG